MLKVLNHNHQYMAAALRSGDESDLAPSLAQPMKDIALPSPSRIRKSAVSSTKETRQVLSPQSAESDVPTLKPSTKKEVPLNTDPVTRFMADASQYLLFTPEREREIGRALMAARTGYLGELLESLPISIYALNVLGRVLGKVPDGKLRADRHLIFKQNEGKAALAKGELSYKTVKALLDRIAQALPTTLDQSLTPDCQLQAKRRIDHSKVVVRTLLEEVRFSDKVVRDFIDRFRTLVSQSESRLAKDSSQSEVQKVFNELGESLESAKERLSRIDEYLHCYREAREDVVKSNLRMVVSIAKNWTGNGISMEDLIGYGMPGLWRAAEKFDVEMGFKFSTYATRWINQGIWRAVDETGEAYDIPVHIGALRRKILKCQREAVRKTGCALSVEELAKAADCSIEDVELVMQLNKNVRRIDAPFRKGDDDSGSLGASLPAKLTSVVEQASFREVQSVVRGILNELDRRDRKILCLRFGIPEDETQQEYPAAMTLKEVGDVLGVTRERVRQLEARALARIQEFASAHRTLGEEIEE